MRKLEEEGYQDRIELCNTAQGTKHFYDLLNEVKKYSVLRKKIKKLLSFHYLLKLKLQTEQPPQNFKS